MIDKKGCNIVQQKKWIVGFAIPFCILWVSALLISTETYLGGFTISSASPSGQSISLILGFLQCNHHLFCHLLHLRICQDSLAVHQLIIAATCLCFFCRNSRSALNKSRCYYNHYYSGCIDTISGNVAFVDIIRRKEESSITYKKQRNYPSLTKHQRKQVSLYRLF